ncbi:MAG: pyruvate ferredoxin oxidoreductase [Nanoarchaeota archaeon]|nr:pyruvate ferredoxin oxidoreductase [Nanoarchaeota archaeon]
MRRESSNEARGGVRMKKVALTGAHASAEAMKQINPDVVPVYPITPQTPMMEKFCYFKAEGEVDTEVVLVESEHSVMSVAVGASAAGARVMTASSSQGISLMNEVLSVASGSRLPILMNVVNRAVSAPLNIHCDQCSTMSVRDLGWVQLFAETSQEAYDLTLIGMKLAEAMKNPVMVCQDGFITSHCVEILEILEQEKARKYVGDYNPKNKLLDVNNPMTFGAWQMPSHYMDTKIEQQKALMDAFKEYPKAAKEYEAVSKRSYGFLEEYKMKDAEAVIVTTGSAAGTTKAVIDRMRDKGKKVGLLKIVLMRPFPYNEIANVLSKAKAACILDRAVAFGGNAPLYGDVMQACYSLNKKPKISGSVFGLGGRELYEEQIEKIFNDLLAGKNTEEYVK